MTMLICFILIVMVSYPLALAFKLTAHIGNAKRNADTMHEAAGGSWTRHYINEWIEKIKE